jgi:hypothetical protein
MDKHNKTAKFVGGPLDGQTRQVKDDQTVFLHEQPPTSDDIREGEVPIGFFPPFHEYVYQEEPGESGTFVFKEQRHQ